MSNPLLSVCELPRFDAIRAEHMEPALDAVLRENRDAIAALTESRSAAEPLAQILQLEDLGLRLQRVWSPIAHLHAVLDTDTVRAAYNNCLPKVTAYSAELAQHDGLYLVHKRCAEQPETLAPAIRKLLADALRDFRLGGIELDPPERTRLRELREALAQAQTLFGQNVLDATHGWYQHVPSDQAAAGVPSRALAQARTEAERRGLPGYVFTLDQPSYQAVMTYAENRVLRRDMHMAFITRASQGGPCAGRWDNDRVMVEILRRRTELAQLLGFANFAELSLATKMAANPLAVLGFLNELARQARPAAERELVALQTFAARELGLQELAPWDIGFATERLRQRLHALSSEELRPYFPLPRVLDGLFAIVERLYDLVVSREEAPSWHPDVSFYRIRDRQGTVRGMFYLDPYAREHKRGGAWMDDCMPRRGPPAATQAPIAYLNCNFAPPVGSDPALLTHDDVQTLLHEFGHGLHHMLTLVDRCAVAGINGVAWDAVELPSQFMENWAFEPAALALLSGHYQSGAPLPLELVQRLRAARNFMSAMQMVRQLELALFDFELHQQTQFETAEVIQRTLDTVRSRVAVVPYAAENRFQNAFTHVFAGGYAAGYYSYKWAEVLAADAFEAFVETDPFDRDTARRFQRTILEQGGAREALELFIEFRGREPDPGALLRHAGIAA